MSERTPSTTIHPFGQGENTAGLGWESVGISIVGRFESCAAALSARPAVIDGTGLWTYDRLNRAANRIAHHLLALRGSEPEPVALLFEQGANFLAALLGVLKAGRFYVPLDPLFPASRNEYILDDSGTTLLLTDRQHLNTAASLARTRISVLDLETCSAGAAEDNPAHPVTPGMYAMIIYTSGSTGVPKGVLHDHRTIIHNAIRQFDLMAFSPDDRFTMLYSSSVMGTVRDYTNALLNGACLYPFDIRTQGLSRLVEFMEENQLTFFHTIPSVFRHLAGLLDRGPRLPNLRFVILGGETLLRADFDVFRDHFPPTCRLFTGLGMTETGTIRQNILGTHSRVEQPIVPLGFPLRDTEILLLDGEGKPVKPGQVGEITVRSAYMALEYWRKPEATRQAFSSPDAEGKRLFRTGDLGEQLPDGMILHRGRKDHQVKVRGFRVELQEIETVILESRLVRDAVVIAFDVRPGDKRLVAYIIPGSGQKDTTRKLRAHLGGLLPDHMLPQMFIELQEMPLTPNGKLDRQALPPPDFNSLAAGDEIPGDDVEAALMELWKELLSISQVGLDDNFFDLGGDSLLASEFFIQVDRRFGRLYPLSLLLEKNTVRQLAEVLRDPASGITRSLVVVREQGTRPPLIIIPGGYGDALYLRQLAKYIHPEQPIYGLQASGTGGDRRYLPSMEEIALQYLVEVRRVQPHGPYLLAGHSFGGYVAIEMARHLLQRGEHVALLAMLDTYPPGPRRQATLLQRVLIHYENLRPLKGRQKVRYLQERWEQLLLRLLHRSSLTRVARRRAAQAEKAIVYSRLARYNYQPDPYPGDLVLFRADARPWYVTWDPMENWPRYIAGNYSILAVPGRHENILFEPHVRQLAAALDAEISRRLETG